MRTLSAREHSLLMVALAVVVGPNPVAAQGGLPEVKVYHSPNDDGLHPNPTCPPAPR